MIAIISSQFTVSLEWMSQLVLSCSFGGCPCSSQFTVVCAPFCSEALWSRWGALASHQTGQSWPSFARWHYWCWSVWSLITVGVTLFMAVGVVVVCLHFCYCLYGLAQQSLGRLRYVFIVCVCVCLCVCVYGCGLCDVTCLLLQLTHFHLFGRGTCTCACIIGLIFYCRKYMCRKSITCVNKDSSYCACL